MPTYHFDGVRNGLDGGKRALRKVSTSSTAGRRASELHKRRDLPKFIDGKDARRASGKPSLPFSSLSFTNHDGFCLGIRQTKLLLLVQVLPNGDCVIPQRMFQTLGRLL